MTKDRKALSLSAVLWMFLFAAAFIIPLPSYKTEQTFGTLSIKLEPLPQTVQKNAVRPLQQDAPEHTQSEQNAPVPKPVKTAQTAKSAAASAQKASAPAKAASRKPPAQKTETASSSPKGASSSKAASPAASSSAAASSAAQAKKGDTKAAMRRENVPLQKSMEQLMAEQARTAKEKTSPVWDDSVFSSGKTVRSSSAASSGQSTASSAFDSANTKSSNALSGSAGTAASREKTSAAVSQSSQENAQTKSKVSGETGDLLAKIGTQKAAFSSSSSAGENSRASSASNADASSSAQKSSFSASIAGTGEINVKTQDGKPRKLLDPAKPVLTISKQNEKLIDSSRKLNVEFTVLPDGNVLPSSIRFSPAALLPPQIQTELSAQLVRWRFEPGSGNGQASFIYSINKR
ncbi:MAG: hypothetical protein ACFNX1_02805 [Treponema lecithinolyticum]|uniref:hypothetical protein n=1 Tax=Treponema lecithinolyticum TaxID=53418 RepID=UPI00361037B0